MSTSFFTYDERDSPAWAKLRAHLQAELDRLRVYNDKNHDAVETATTRGEIARIKWVLALGEEPKPTPVKNMKEVVGL